MKDDDDTKQTVVELAKERFQLCQTANAENRRLAKADTRFALGDSDNKWQWPDGIATARAASQRPCLTVNLTAQHCNQVVNGIRQNRPQLRVLASGDDGDKGAADLLAGMIRAIHHTSNADDAHDVAAEHSILGGEGYWRVISEYESETSFNQVLKVKAILNPNLVFIDPNTQELDRSDAMFGFVFVDRPKNELAREYPELDVSSWGPMDDGWTQTDTVRECEYFYAEYVKDEALMLYDGSTVLRNEFSGDESLIYQRRPTQRKQWTWCKLIGGSDEPQDVREWPGKYLPIISVTGKEINIDGQVSRKGLVRDLKDSARMVNYSYSATVETLGLQNKVPYMAAVEAIEGYEDTWARANLDNSAYLPFNAYDDETGNALPRPERQAPAVMPAAQVQMLQLSIEQMRGASGQQSASFGIKSEAASGIGIQRLKNQGDVATFHFPDNQVRGLRYEAKVLIDLIPRIYDTRRVVQVLGLDGQETTATIDPEALNAYSESGVGKSLQKIFNPNFGMYGVVIDTGPSFATQRQEAFTSLTELASRSPQLMQVAGDIIMRAADFPMAEELAERLKKTLPPELRDPEDQDGDGQPDTQVDPAMQQQMQQGQQQLQQAGVQIQELQKKLEDALNKNEVEKDKLSIAAYDAETKRMAALGGGMSAEQITMLVQQTLQQMIQQPDPLEQEREEGQEPGLEGYEPPAPMSEQPDAPETLQIDPELPLDSAQTVPVQTTGTPFGA